MLINNYNICVTILKKIIRRTLVLLVKGIKPVVQLSNFPLTPARGYPSIFFDLKAFGPRLTQPKANSAQDGQNCIIIDWFGQK